jgi:L-alanine-DL-glutamate epimerase-like enolase superfamily enzyme
VKIRSIQIHQLHIPFNLELAHSMASRAFSDSLVVEVRTEAAAGYGEAVVREYVSGRLSADGNSAGALLEAAASIVGRLAEPLRGCPTWPRMRACLEAAEAAPHELPLLCGLEGAVLDAACAEEGKDVYGLLGLPPARLEMRYGGTLPFITKSTAEKLIRILGVYHPRDLRVKVGPDASYADAVLGMVRARFGPDYDIRVDANAGWSWRDAMEHLPVLRKHGVRLIEEPFGRDSGDNLRFARDYASSFLLVADESALTPADVARMAAEGTFRMVNIRLAKNGGLLRALGMAETARRAGIAFQLGSHVGETGILSAAGRVAASLLPDAVYLEGSYDELVLSQNVTEENYTFGFDGRVAAIMGRRVGYQVSRDALKRLSTAVRDCT